MRTFGVRGVTTLLWLGAAAHAIVTRGDTVERSQDSSCAPGAYAVAEGGSAATMLSGTPMGWRC